MSRGEALIALGLLATVATVGAPARAAAPSPLTLAVVTEAAAPVAAWRAESSPRLVLAQRAIEREWSVAGDSGTAGLHVEGLRSELGAASLSAALPGTGQLYVGRRSGYAFAAAEVAGWLGYLLLRGSGRELRDDARTLAGVPEDSASAWSFERWEASGADASEVKVLYAGDREAFFDAIGSDERYAAGWSSPETRRQFGDLRGRSSRRLEQARWTGGALWVNHLVAAVDALRAARLSNLDLQLAGDVEFKARGSWRRGHPSLVVSLERRF